MKKIVKGSIAAGAAGVLLLGGLSTMSYWSDSEELDGGIVTAGNLSLGEPNCETDWVYGADNAGAGNTVSLIVPGDTITKECTFLITASGDNLEAELTIPADTTITTDPDGTTLTANVSATYVSDGAAIDATITEANDGNTVTATIEVEFPFGNDSDVNANDMQNVIAQLATIPITLTQTES